MSCAVDDMVCGITSASLIAASAMSSGNRMPLAFANATTSLTASIMTARTSGLATITP